MHPIIAAFKQNRPNTALNWTAFELQSGSSLHCCYFFRFPLGNGRPHCVYTVNRRVLQQLFYVVAAVFTGAINWVILNCRIFNAGGIVFFGPDDSHPRRSVSSGRPALFPMCKMRFWALLLYLSVLVSHGGDRKLWGFLLCLSRRIFLRLVCFIVFVARCEIRFCPLL